MVFFSSVAIAGWGGKKEGFRGKEKGFKRIMRNNIHF